MLLMGLATLELPIQDIATVQCAIRHQNGVLLMLSDLNCLYRHTTHTLWGWTSSPAPGSMSCYH